MGKLHFGIEIRDFDLERLGFSLSVTDETHGRQVSEGYLRMSLAEMNAFIGALRAASETVDVATFETMATGKTVGASKSSREPFETARRKPMVLDRTAFDVSYGRFPEDQKNETATGEDTHSGRMAGAARS